MKLRRVRITDFQSIRDSNEFEVGDLTCLVGKNEAGKTALLQALYRLNPINEVDGRYDVTDDYPRAEVEEYRQAVHSGVREQAVVVAATFTLEEEDIQPVCAELGKDALASQEVTLTKGYSGRMQYVLKTDLEGVLRYIVADVGKRLGIGFPSDDPTLEEVMEGLRVHESTSESKVFLSILSGIQQKGLDTYVYDRFLASRIPKFLYFDEYYQMRGCENIEVLKKRVSARTLQPADHPLLGLIALARLDIDEILKAQRTEELVNKLEGAGNYLGRQVLNYWSQNRHLQMRFDARPGKAGDPEGMREGTNIWTRVYDSRHMVTTNLGARSRGFVWFFSFLAWYSKVRRDHLRLILLLDEPGLMLHGRAQGDLLTFFERELKSSHQLIYTTHSPFMVDPHDFSRVRIVQDKGLDDLGAVLFEQEGTKVLTDVLEATGDSLFPLQGALGYELYQTLFIGPNSLIVEGVSDLIYLQAMSELLEREGRKALSKQWTITPVGGAEKVPTFVALIGAQRGMNIATLIDVQAKDKQRIENLFKRKLLKKSKVLTFADFTGQPEADIEDMFNPDFYLRLVNEEYDSALKQPIKASQLNTNYLRITARLEAYFRENPLRKNWDFNHYRPARYLTENMGRLREHLAEDTLDRFEEAFRRLNTLL